MNARRIEERQEVFMGQTLTYYVTVFEALPAPSTLDPCSGSDAELIVARPAAPAPGHCNVASQTVAPRVPSKAEYVRGFCLAGALPGCVQSTVLRGLGLIALVRDWFATDGDRMPRRLLRVLDRLDTLDLSTFYDRDWMVRLTYYYGRHCDRFGARVGVAL